MKIAIVCPIESEDPAKTDQITYGGAEKLYDDMLYNLNKYSEDDFELVCVKSDLQTFWGVIETYKDFFYLDLIKYDKVIVTKTASWMVKSKNKILYMIHPQRGLYDLYCSQEKISEKAKNNENLKTIFEILHSREYTRENFIKLYYELIKNKKQINLLQINSPSGPFMQEIVHFFDKIGLNECTKYYCMSKTVKARKQYFPNKKNIKIVYPPIEDSKYRSSGYEYFIFTASRISNLKRIDLIIEAFKKIKDKNIKLKIAGTGTEMSRLKKLAEKDKRIEFLGFVSNKKIREYYSKCLFVIFTPYKEDYGFITLEAMKSKKAVLTCSDSGGPTEFIKNKINGIISKPKVSNLSNAIKFMLKNRMKTIKMGNNAFNSVKEINWKRFTSELGLNIGIKKEKTKEIISLNSYSVQNAMFGGQIRIKNILLELSKKYKITSLNSIMPGNFKENYTFNDNFKEINIKLDELSIQEISDLNREFSTGTDDIYREFTLKRNKEFLRVLKKHCNKNKILICQHPFMYPFIKKMPSKLLIYDAQNIEYLLKKQILGNTKKAKFLLKHLFKNEKEISQKANYIISVSEEDKKSLSSIYNIPLNKIKVIPNGADCTNICPITKIEKNEIRKDLNLDSKKICIFMGSYHKPNVEALLKIIELAKENKDILFFIIGEVIRNYYDLYGNKLPNNIIAFGKISEEEKQTLLKCADFAINPMFTGSGTNLKIIEYLAAGIPVITTEFGSRGLDLTKVDLIFMNKRTKKINLKDLKEINTLKNRKYIEENFDWTKIGERYTEFLRNAKN